MNSPDRMAVTRTIVVDPESEGQRLDVFLAANLVDRTRSYIQKLIDDQYVQVGGRSVRASHRVKRGERVEIRDPPPRPAEPIAQPISLKVLYEDSDLLVLDKAAGLVVHPAPGNPDGTLVNALLHHCKDLSGIGGVLRPGIVHRLDRGTSGVMVVTKNDRAHGKLSRQFSEHTTEKTYVAFAGRLQGAKPLPDSGRFDTLFGRHPVHRKRFYSKVERGKKARTDFRVISRFDAKTWSAVHLQARPHTGRTHQIRVHFADAGHPLLGDKLYGGRSARVFPEAILLNRTALHALSLSFIHPTRDERVTFSAPLPPDLVELEGTLRQLSLTE